MVNVVLLFVVTNLLEWDLVPFLTDDFDRVVPIISLSLAATIAVNVLYLVSDTARLKSLTQIGLLGINMAATVRLFQVFPFDYTAYDFDWAAVTRVVLIASMLGIGIAAIVEVLKLGRSQ